MVSNENQLPPIEILKQLAQCCDQIEEQTRQGKSVDLDSYVSGFPSEHQALVRSELQELLIELGLSTYRPEPFRKTEGYETSTQYHIIEPLGHGGMGLVNVAIDDDFRRRVALKEIRPSQADDEYYQHRFLQEAEISAKLEHPGILPIYNRGLNDQQQPFYTMRLIAGGEAKTLQQAIRDHHQHLPGSPEFINQHRILVRHLIDACNTVAYAHNQGVCHRDLKPANILIGPFGETLVVDWGLAKVFRDSESFSTSNLKNLAGSPKFDASGRSHSQGVGTLGFVAPENQGPEPIGDWPRIDVYSLGAILYCILTGLAPKESHSGNSARRKTDSGKTDSGTQFQRQIDSHVQKNIAAVCMKALCPDPSNRYGSALELAADLERYLAGEPVSALAESWFDQLARWSNRNRKLVAVSVLLGGILAGLSVFSAVQQANYNKRLTEESRKLSDALKEQERLRGQEQLAREMAQKQESMARRRELLALDSMRAYSQAILDNQTLKNSESLRSVRRELLEKPIEFFEKIQRDESEIEAPSWNYLEQLAKTCEDLSKLSFEYGDSAQAVRWAEQTIERYRQLTSKAMAIESTTPKQIVLAKIALAGAYRLRATNLMLTGQADLAENDLQESTDLFSEIRPESEWIEELLHGRSLLNAIRAVRAAETNRMDQMNDYFKSAISDRQELISLAVGQKKLNREKELQDLLQDQALVGLTFRTGDIDAHFRQFESYLGMLKERINNGDRTEETRLRLAWACSNLANRLIDYGRIDQCEPVLLEALQRRKELLNDFPSVTRYRFDLARTQSDYAFFLWNQHRYSDAIVQYESSVTNHRLLTLDDPGSLNFRLELMAQTHQFGHLLLEDFKDEQGAKLFDESFSLSQQGLPEHPSLANLTRELLGHQAHKLMQLGNWQQAKTILSSQWQSSTENGSKPEVTFPDKDQILEHWLLCCERAGDEDSKKEVLPWMQYHSTRNNPPKLQNESDLNGDPSTLVEGEPIWYWRVKNAQALVRHGGIEQYRLAVEQMQRGLDHFRTTLAASEFPVGTQPRRVQVLRLWDATARDPIFVPLRLASAVEKLPIEDQYAWKKIWEQIESTSREFA